MISPPSAISDAFKRYRTQAPEATAVAASASRETAAPLVIKDAVHCPYCNKKMVPTKAVGVDVYYCADDRHVGPMECSAT